MLMQTNPPAAFDQRWPAGWHWADMAQYFDRVRQRIPVTSTPSTDGVPQNTGPADIAHPLYASEGWVETDTSRPFDAAGAYSRPYVAAGNGRRRGPLSGYYEAVAPGGTPGAGLEVLQYAKASLIEFDASGRAVAVQYVKRDGLDQSLPGTEGRARVRADGFVVMSAGALVTPRLLLLSGVGPRGREAEMFPGQARAPFAIDNPGVGVGLYDHVITMVTYAYDGAVPYAAYDYGDYAGNAGDLARYMADGSGPYAQYQPVSILQRRYGSAVPNVEVFLNPNGAGTPGGPYWGPRTFSAFVMLLDARARGVVALDAKGNVIPPAIYLPPTADGEADTDLMTQGVFDMMKLFAKNPALKLVFGPGSPSHPDLRPDVMADVRKYVTGPSPVDGVHFNRLVTNHWGGTAALQRRPGRSRSGHAHRARDGQRRGRRRVAHPDERPGPSGPHHHGGRGPRGGHPRRPLDLKEVHAHRSQCRSGVPCHPARHRAGLPADRHRGPAVRDGHPVEPRHRPRAVLRAALVGFRRSQTRVVAAGAAQSRTPPSRVQLVDQFLHGRGAARLPGHRHAVRGRVRQRQRQVAGRLPLRGRHGGGDLRPRVLPARGVPRHAHDQHRLQAVRVIGAPSTPR